MAPRPDPDDPTENGRIEAEHAEQRREARAYAEEVVAEASTGAGETDPETDEPRGSDA